ncbi:Hypothetical protein Cul131001_2380 [Corynebacterium ulcerans]|nr:Hypothetical protein Cul131001_2380 [Corynebacterium ulcerans]
MAVHSRVSALSAALTSPKNNVQRNEISPSGGENVISLSTGISPSCSQRFGAVTAYSTEFSTTVDNFPHWGV